LPELAEAMEAPLSELAEAMEAPLSELAEAMEASSSELVEATEAPSFKLVEAPSSELTVATEFRWSNDLSTNCTSNGGENRGIILGNFTIMGTKPRELRISDNRQLHPSETIIEDLMAFKLSPDMAPGEDLMFFSPIPDLMLFMPTPRK